MLEVTVLQNFQFPVLDWVGWGGGVAAEDQVKAEICH